MNEHLLNEKLNSIHEQLKKQVIDQKEILNLHEAALFLCISKSTLYKMTHKRSIPFHKPSGKLILFKKKELLSWIEGSGLTSISKKRDNDKEERRSTN